MYSKLIQNMLRSPAWIAVIISLLLSTINVINDDSINSDGIRYVEAASLFLEQGWQASFAHYKWPFYQILIAIVSKLTFLDLEHAAYVINAGLLAGLAFAFVRCSEYLGGDKRVSWAALVILMTHLNLNGYRDLIIRDFGYWCFFFIAFLMLLKFHKNQQHRYLFFYTGSMLIATLFRIEGIIFLVLGPLVLLWKSTSFSKTFKNLVVCWGPLIFIAIIGSLVLLSNDTVGNSMGRLSEPLEYFKNGTSNLVTGIKDKGKLLEETILGVHARNLGTQSFIAILIMMLVTKLFSATGLIPVLLSIRTFTAQHLRDSVNYMPVFLWFVILNVFVLSSFLLAEFFLSGRYAITFALLLCLPASVALSSIFRTDRKPSRKLKVLRWAIATILVYMLLDGVTSFSAGKVYRRDAADWLAKNVSEEKLLLSNDELMFYYSGRSVQWQELSTVYEKTRFGKAPEQAIKDYDVIAIHISRKQIGFDEKVIAWVGNEPVHRSKNKRGDMMLIFKVNK